MRQLKKEKQKKPERFGNHDFLFVRAFPDIISFLLPLFQMAVEMSMYRPTNAPTKPQSRRT